MYINKTIKPLIINIININNIQDLFKKKVNKYMNNTINIIKIKIL